MSDSRTGAEYVVAALEEYGVEHLFGNPGTTEIPIVQNLGDSSIEYVLGLHEDVSVGMAAGYAQTRRYHSHHDESVNPLGVANLHVAPGLAHGIGNLIGAHFSGAPLLVTAGTHSTDFQHEEPILSGDLEAMVDQFTKWSAEIKHVDALPTMLRRAVRQALTPPTGPVFLAFPLDVMLAETDADVERLGTIPDAGRGDPTSVAAAAEAMIAADDPVVVVGDRIAHSGPDAIEAAVAFAEASGARVHGEFLPGEINFPTDHRLFGGNFHGSAEQLAADIDTDTVFFVGCGSMTTSLSHDNDIISPETNVVQIGPNARELGKNWPADTAVIGDPGHVLAELAAELEADLPESERTARLERAETAAERARDERKPNATGTENERASKIELGEAMREAVPGALYVDEGVTTGRVVRSYIPFGPEDQITNKSGGLGYGLPASIGAAVAERERPDPRDVVALIGDGSYFYYPQSIYSAVRYDLDLTVVVANNRNYRILKDNTLRVLGGEEADHEFVAMDFEPPLDIPTNAESYGADSRVVDSPDRIASAITAGRNDDGTTVLDVLIHD